MTMPNDAPRGVFCPICQAKPGEPCTQPDSRSRHAVSWYHSGRGSSAEQIAAETATATTVSITQVFTVPDAHILALIDCAGVYTGIGYWTEDAIADKAARTFTVVPDAMAREDPEIQRRVLKFDWIAKRLVQLGVGSPLLEGIGINDQAREYLADLVNSDESISRDADTNFDSDLADVVIQLAFFDGKVVFG